MQTIVITPTFERQAREIGLTPVEEAAIVARIARAPESGDLIRGSGGARKLRHGGRGKGKSGSFRTVHYFAGADIPIFLLSVYTKSTVANLKRREVALIANLLMKIAENYREGR